MGGPVNIAERRNGVVSTIDAYTGQLHMVQDLRYLNDTLPESHWFMKKKRDPNPSSFYPDGYGLMVVDFDRKWIGHIQGYTDPATFHDANLHLSINGNIIRGEKEDLPHKVFIRAFEAGAITGFHYYDSKQDALVFKALNEPIKMGKETQVLDTKEKILDWVSTPKKNFQFLFFEYQPLGWTIEKFDESMEGYLSFFKALLARDFDMRHSIESWKEFVSEKFGDDDDNIEEAIQAFDDELSLHLRSELNEQVPQTDVFPSVKKTL